MKEMSKRADKPRAIELLSPAKDVDTAMCAITHGADAVYIGPEGFGARSAAANSTDDIRRLCEFAHPFRARVYATVNTLVLDRELKRVERLVCDLYKAGVDAIIVQDMGILRLDIPPIALHASTQCDTRTPSKARFLQESGFSQIVLARELTLRQIGDICSSVTVPVETFVHGALCVSYSGRCQASYALCGRSANRGRCAQVCRLPYSLLDADGRTICEKAHLLSLKDFNASDMIPALLEAGVSSFKIEGRLKDKSYVKNVTAYYRQVIDREISSHPDMYARASCGESRIGFTPDPYKSFNRGFTHFFLTDRRAHGIATLRTPKSMGEKATPDMLWHAGDGVSFFTPAGEYTGARVNKVDSNGKPVFARNVRIPEGTQLYRTTDMAHETLMGREDTAERKIAFDVELHENRLVACDERGCRVALPMPEHGHDARKPLDARRFFDKTGDTIYRLRSFVSYLDADTFIPASVLTRLRRELLDLLDENARASFTRPVRVAENRGCPYPDKSLVYADNVANRLAESFYRDHGVLSIEPALEANPDYRAVESGKTVMTTRHCILRELGMCKRDGHTTGHFRLKEPLVIANPGGARFTLAFDCGRCEMRVLKR